MAEIQDSLFQKLATSLVGQLVVPDCTEEMEVRLELDTMVNSGSQSRSIFVKYADRITDIETAFNLSHP